MRSVLRVRSAGMRLLNCVRRLVTVAQKPRRQFPIFTSDGSPLEDAFDSLPHAPVGDKVASYSAARLDAKACSLKCDFTASWPAVAIVAANGRSVRSESS
jgi:hypothetical protein